MKDGGMQGHVCILVRVYKCILVRVYTCVHARVCVHVVCANCICAFLVVTYSLQVVRCSNICRDRNVILAHFLYTGCLTF